MLKRRLPAFAVAFSMMLVAFPADIFPYEGVQRDKTYGSVSHDDGQSVPSVDYSDSSSAEQESGSDSKDQPGSAEPETGSGGNEEPETGSGDNGDNGDNKESAAGAGSGGDKEPPASPGNQAETVERTPASVSGGSDEDDAADDAVPGLLLSASKRKLLKGETLMLEARFDGVVESNAATLVFKYNSGAFEYVDFEPAPGVIVFNADSADGELSIVVVTPGQDMMDFGTAEFLAKRKADLAGEKDGVELQASYVTQGDGEKSVETVSAKLSFDEEYAEEDVSVFMALSNMLDVFGIDSTDELWKDYEDYDYNGDSAIDIHDVTLAARLIIENPDDSF